MKEERNPGFWLRQIEHIGGHMRNIYSVSVNQVKMGTIKLSKY